MSARLKHRNLLTYRFLRVENLHLNDILGESSRFFQSSEGVLFVGNLFGDLEERKLPRRCQHLEGNVDEVLCLHFGLVNFEQVLMSGQSSFINFPVSRN